MELQHFSHKHPLIFNEERSHESDDNAFCSGCGAAVSGPCFSCVECGFYLDNKCAKAPIEMNHPFHCNHSLNLLESSPYGEGACTCNFCDKYCENFVYHCSCNLDLHIKCALFLYDVAEKKIGDQLQWIENKDPSISTENHSEELKEAECFVCWKPLLGSAYLSLDSGFFLHKKCAELPLEINHLCHRQHSLFLQFNLLPCKICEETQRRGLSYYCPICKFVLHIECVSPPPTIEDTSSHEHSFTRLLLRISSFTCDACGTSGKHVSYVCSTCSLIVHKKCTSLPRIIKSILHQHLVFYKYFVVDSECGALECVICHEEVNKECGNYYCADCKFILHVNCALQDPRWYYKVESRDAFEKLNKNGADTMDPSFFVIKEIRHGENVINTEIKHFSHQHNLILHDEVKDHKCCDGCSQLIETSFYGCLQCDFFLHKPCAQLPRKKQIWGHFHQYPLDLISDCVFLCAICSFGCSGFSYKCEICDDLYCVRCAGRSSACTSQGHKHPLLFYLKYDGQCNVCGGSIHDLSIFRCKGCDFNVHYQCLLLPQTARHKCDEHFLTLTNHEDNDYSEYHYCDICEEKRSPSNWFYYCAICDKSAHPKCVLGDHPFVKRGSSIFIESEHPHSLVFVQKVYPYPECCKCGQPCLGLALECAETRCNYIVHCTCGYPFPREPFQIQF
ncbi:uncharacterized protein LOC111297610 [Durio zibethinus]|uniref:Uncharacterized protein LOC111297610 n=1 Tax=Durio zibethinus TaxID=66656 RepID=A0A6P5Z5Z8_DURZI|nr:uncharacterized protein LOC111297610 [Durio zibethinus]